MKPGHLLIPLALALASLAATAPAHAAAPRTVNVTFTVDSTGDSVDAVPGDGVCADASGQCTLRAAIMEANALAGPDTIVFAPSTDGTPIRLTLHGAGEDSDATGDLDVLDDLTITGNGTDNTTVDGDGADRVFDVINGTLDLQHVTVQNGGAVALGGGIRIRNGATLNLFNAHVADNHAANSTGAANGGGIEADSGASLGIDICEISGNSAESTNLAQGGGLAIDTSNAVGILVTTISDNTATSATAEANGGGIHSIAALQLVNSSVRGNTAHADQNDAGGGGIDEAGGYGGSLTLSQVEVSNNAAEAPNGAAYGGAIDSGTPVTLINTTVTGNRGANVGGLYQGSGLLTLVNATIAGNNSSNGIGGVFVFSSASASIADTLIAGNSGNSPDCQNGGTITSYGYNLIGDTTHCTFAAATGDQFGTAANPIDPMLGPLSTGGQTHVLPLLAGSPAIDAADPQLQSQGGTCQATDQLGTPRPIDGNADGTAVCDIGAYERPADQAPVADDGSASANENASASGSLNASDPDGDPLTFAVASPPAHGSVTITDPARGSFTYTPDRGYSGKDSFTFTASDGYLNSNTATESLSVNASAGGSGGGGGGAFGPFALLGLLALALALLARRRHSPSTAARSVAAAESASTKRSTTSRLSTAAIAAFALAGGIAAAPAFATPLALDASFGNGGLVQTDLTSNHEDDGVSAVLIQPDGKILVAGSSGPVSNYAVALARYTGDGSLDPAFGGGVIIRAFGAGGLTLSEAVKVALQPDGKVLVLGFLTDGATAAKILIARFNADGSPDSGFGDNGFVVASAPGATVTEPAAFAVAADGSFYVAGTSNASQAFQNFTARFLADGSPDTGFGSDGFVTTDVGGQGTESDAFALAPAPGGGVYVAGRYDADPSPNTYRTDSYVIEYTASGQLDTSFGTGGVATLTVSATSSDEVTAMALQPDGELILGGDAQNNIPSSQPYLAYVARLKADGTLDTGFGTNGLVEIANGNDVIDLGALIETPDGHIAFAGRFDNGGGSTVLYADDLAPNGQIVDSVNLFGNPYPAVSSGDAAALQPDGKIVFAGTFKTNAGSDDDFGVVRFQGAPLDLTPDAFSFTAQTDVARDSTITSNAITVSGLDNGASVPVRVAGGEYEINGNGWTGDPGLAQNGDQIAVRHTSSGSYATQTSTTLSIGGYAAPDNPAIVLGSPVSAEFTSTTEAAPPSNSGGGGGGGAIGPLASFGLLLLALVPWGLRRKRTRHSKPHAEAQR